MLRKSETMHERYGYRAKTSGKSFPQNILGLLLVQLLQLDSFHRKPAGDFNYSLINRCRWSDLCPSWRFSSKPLPTQEEFFAERFKFCGNKSEVGRSFWQEAGR